MDIKSLGSVLLGARKAKGWRQEDVAAEISSDRRRIADYESGKMQPDELVRPKLARALALSPRLLEKLYIPPHEPGLGTANLFCREKPRFTPKGERDTPWRLLALWRGGRSRFNAEWNELGQRPDWPGLRRFYLTVRTDSRYEAQGWLTLTLAGMEAARLAPQRCGYRGRAVVNPDTLEVVGDCRVPALVARDGLARIIFPQASLAVGSSYARPDGLVGVRVKGGTRWCASEFDGPGHDPFEDSGRATQLGMPVVRFSGREVLDPAFARLFWRKVYRALNVPE